MASDRCHFNSWGLLLLLGLGRRRKGTGKARRPTMTRLYDALPALVDAFLEDEFPVTQEQRRNSSRPNNTKKAETHIGDERE